MWSLPDINRMNAEASTSKRKLERAVRTGTLNRHKLTCEHEGDDCRGEQRRYLWYDIFSQDPKGVLTLCEKHDGYYGSPDEGYFDCVDCQRIMTENYTWELYYVNTDDGQVCLPCYAQRILSEPERWILLTDEAIDALTFEQIRQAPHCIGVKMPVPEGIQYVNEVTFDSSTGGAVRGFSSADSTPDAGVAELRQILWDLKAIGETKAILILDGGYQFAVSIGVYAPTKGGPFDAQKDKKA